jgi:MerR family transcriptional regulator, heat shock protein HspR
MDAPVYTVGQVAAMLRVQPAFLRRLDSEDLVRPERSGGGQRRHTRTEIDQIYRVSELAGEGLTLAGIRRLLALEAEVAQLRRPRHPHGQASPTRGRAGRLPSDQQVEIVGVLGRTCPCDLG